MSSSHRKWIVFGTSIVAALLFAIVFMPLTAQDAAPAFATNTPQGTAQSTLLTFATNTPQPTISGITVPDAPINRYALRSWDESSLVSVLLDQIQQLQTNAPDRQMGVQLLQNELQKRFPGAPHDPAQRETLLQAMLLAPRGSVDMRFVVQPYIEAGLNELKPSFEATSALDYKGFSLSIMPANIDGVRGTDAAILIQYPATSEPALYKSYVLASIDVQGIYHILPADYLAIPFSGYELLNLERVGDLNGDGLDELAVSFDRPGDDNGEMTILGWRGGAVVNLIQLGTHVHFLGSIQWDAQTHSFVAQEFQSKSPAWQCFSQRAVTWTWSLNFFRPPAQPDTFTLQNRLGCLLFGAEPLFEKPISQSLDAIGQVAPSATPDDLYAAQRAAMIAVMLHVFSGDLAEALDQVKQLQAVAQPGSWLEKETNAFMQAANQSNTTPLQLCAILQNASAYGGCDVNQVLARLFKEQPLHRNEPIEAQAARLGLSVLDQATISAVGRLDRQAVRFDLAGNQWWAFAPLGEDTFTAEAISTPPGYETADAPTLLITPPLNAYDALLLEGNPAAVLAILDNAIHSNPGTKLDGSAWFLQALSYDLLADRTHARQTYFDLWSNDPASVWGQLAAAHLEHR